MVWIVWVMAYRYVARADFGPNPIMPPDWLQAMAVLVAGPELDRPLRRLSRRAAIIVWASFLTSRTLAPARRANSPS